MQSIDKRLRSRIYGSGRGSVFTPDRFLDLGNRTAIDKALSRLAAEGVLQRLDRGLYHFPKNHPQLGTLAPAVEAIAKALAGKQAGRLQPAGAYAANLLGLSTQVPAKVVYYTELPSKRVRVGKQTIELKQTTPKNMATAGRISGMVIQAFKHLGKEHIDQSRIEMLKRRLPPKDRKQLLRDLPLAPGWMHVLFRQIASD